MQRAPRRGFSMRTPNTLSSRRIMTLTQGLAALQRPPGGRRPLACHRLQGSRGARGHGHCIGLHAYGRPAHDHASSIRKGDRAREYPLYHQSGGAQCGPPSRTRP
eukprot:scaffold1541_cov418-Prasinococcus_capsulatus_cf.AAC.3